MASTAGDWVGYLIHEDCPSRDSCSGFAVFPIGRTNFIEVENSLRDLPSNHFSHQRDMYFLMNTRGNQSSVFSGKRGANLKFIETLLNEGVDSPFRYTGTVHSPNNLQELLTTHRFPALERLQQRCQDAGLRIFVQRRAETERHRVLWAAQRRLADSPLVELKHDGEFSY
jgi:hypothetical protein